MKITLELKEVTGPKGNKGKAWVGVLVFKDATIEATWSTVGGCLALLVNRFLMRIT